MTFNKKMKRKDNTKTWKLKKKTKQTGNGNMMTI